MKLKRWSNSKLTSLFMCGERFRRRYEENESVPPNFRMLAGTVVHAVAKTIHRKQQAAKVAGESYMVHAYGAIPPRAEIDLLARTTFAEQMKKGVQLTVREQESGETAIRIGDQFLQNAVDMSVFYAEKVAPGMDVVAVEREVVVKPDGSDIEISGITDLITQTPDGQAEVINDLKTTAKSPSKNAADDSQQLTMYGMLRAAETTGGKPPEQYTLHHLVRTRPGTPIKYVPLHTRRSMKDVQVLVRRINAAVSAAEAGNFIPAQPGIAWWCSANWCEYWTTCKYVNPTRGAEEIDGE